MTQRDWQKDMDLVQGTIKHDAFPAWTEPMLYWLQEAKECGEREQRLKEAVEEHLPDMMPVTRALMKRTLSTIYPDIPAPTTEIKQQFAVRPLDEWHEEMGDMLWWMFPIQEPPYCGNPLDSDWSDCYTHWTPFVIPAAPAPKEGE
jgi:hypothetical protein